jgi:hypothetical protein
MGMLLAFAPFLAFAVVERIFGPAHGLVAGTLVSLALIIRDMMTPSRAPKILEIGTMVLFGALTLYTFLGSPSWSVIGVRLCVDAGLLLIVLASMALGQPFTMQYARERVPPEVQATPAFRRTNFIISGVWALAFAAMVAAEAALLFLPGLPHRIGIAVIVLALVGAVKFTGWYPDHVARRAS